MKNKKLFVLALLLLAAVFVLISCDVKQVVKISPDNGGTVVLQYEMTVEEYNELNPDGTQPDEGVVVEYFTKDGVEYVRLSQTQDYATYEELSASMVSGDTLAPFKEFTIEKDPETGDICIRASLDYSEDDTSGDATGGENNGSEDSGTGDGITVDDQVGELLKKIETYVVCFEMPGNIRFVGGGTDGIRQEGDCTVVVDILALSQTPGIYHFELVSSNTYTPPATTPGNDTSNENGISWRSPFIVTLIVILCAVAGIGLGLFGGVAVVAAVVVVIITLVKKKKARKLNVLDDIEPDMAAEDDPADTNEVSPSEDL